MLPVASPVLSDRNAPFEQWFAGSAVVGSNGLPAVLFHGTDADFDEFELTEDIGFHFGPLSAAHVRLEHMAGESGVFSEGANIRPVVLSIRRPLRISDLHTWGPRAVLRMLSEKQIITAAESDETEIVDREFVRGVMMRSDFDGFSYENETEGHGFSWIALDAGQIRPWWSRSAQEIAGSGRVTLPI